MSDLFSIRKEKHAKLNNSTFPISDSNHIPISDILQKDFSITSLNPSDLQEPFYIQGRISNFRKSGGICFIKIFDSSDSIQLIATKNSLSNFSDLSLLDLGDIIEVKGQACLSKTNEKSILINEWKVLTKSHNPPPEKYAGISESKYQKRYLDLMSDEDSRSVFIIRTYAIRAIRKFMEDNNFFEVETSTLNNIYSGANAKPFTTHHNAVNKDLYLRIAPELYLKRLLVGGFDKVFEIGKNYRNEGISARHNPEFTFLEFYETYGHFKDLISYAEKMIVYVDNYISYYLPDRAKLYYNKKRLERTYNLSKFKQVKMVDAVLFAVKKFNIELDDQFNVISNPNNINLSSLPDNKGLRIFYLFETIVEKYLVDDYVEDGLSIPIFITDYPEEVCPLARKNGTGYCDRFELFVDGRELANAFQELNDPDEQEKNFKEQVGDEAMPYDEDFITALRHGMPPTIGFGMGIDRFIMLLVGASTIKDVILFPSV